MDKIRNNYFGEGIVEDNNDPLKIGRVRLRDPNNESPDKITTEMLEWYYPCLPFFNGPDFGSIVIPPVGAYVWYFIQDMDVNSPPRRIYLGGSGYGIGTTASKTIGTKEYPANVLETPLEMQVDYPNAKIIYKTQDGSIIYLAGNDDIILKNKNGTVVQLNSAIVMTKQTEQKSVLVWIDENQVNVVLNDKNVVLNDDSIKAIFGTTEIDLLKDTINIKATNVNINSANLNVKGISTFENHVIMKDGLDVKNGIVDDGGLNVSGTTNLNGTTTIEGVSFIPHTHDYTDTYEGGYTTGPTGPVNT